MTNVLLPLLPTGNVYCEPYGGGASMLFAMPVPYPVEVYNDLDDRLVNLFRVIQDPKLFAQFERRVTMTLYSRSEMLLAIEQINSDDPVEKAWAMFVGINHGFAGKFPKSAGSWGRAFTYNRGMAKIVSSWLARIDLLQDYHNRLKRVQIDHIDAIECVKYWDRPDTVFYVDPPYPQDTRVKSALDIYHTEATDEHLHELADVLSQIRGQAMVSTYASPIFDSLLSAGYHRTEFQRTLTAANNAGGAKQPKRIEVVYRKVKEIGLFAV